MTITVTGILKNPQGVAIQNTEIFLEQTQSSTEILQGASTSVVTSATGAYSFILAQGTYVLKILQQNEQHYRTVASNILITNSMNNYSLNQILMDQAYMENMDYDLVSEVFQARDGQVQAAGASQASQESALASKNAAATSETNALASKNAAATSATNAATSETNALTSKNAAQASDTSAQNSATQASTSATNAATSETNALASKNAAATSATNAASSQSAALTSKNAAATSETNALASKNAAATSATNAATSETNALTSKNAAQASATSAQNSATNAATSETNALASKNAAATSATNAASSQSAALTSKNAAATSATNAATSETNALTSKNAAQASATSAQNSATQASTSATNAATSETNAATSATNAATSETNALASKNAAATSATNAASSQSAALTSKNAAATSATNAATSETNALASKNAAQASQTNAANSQTAAANSQTAAATSQTTATTKATEASNSAQAALTSKNAAQTSEANALASKNAAQTSQTTATTKASEAAASQTTASTKAGEAAASQTQAQQSQSDAGAAASQADTSEQQAQQSQTSASTSQATATTKASEASSSAQAALASKNAAQTSETNALASKNQAQTSQTNAANSQSAAAGSQTTATTKAGEASTSQTAAAGSQTTATTEASEASTSQTNATASQTTATTKAGEASTSQTAAAGSQSTATTKATESANSATLAQKWAANPENSVVSGGLYSALHYAAKAAQSAQTASGQLIWRGGWSAQAGTAPPTPAVSTQDFYRITATGTILSVEYAVGDYIHWDNINSIWFKMDGTDSVTSVNGRTGAVVVTKTDVGLSAVNNWGASSQTNDASTTTYATTAGVKAAYDLAATKLTATANAVSATKLVTARTINGTNFDGTANITTQNWGTSRNLTIGGTAKKAVNGSADVSWTLAEIGAAPAGFGLGGVSPLVNTKSGFFAQASPGQQGYPNNGAGFQSTYNDNRRAQLYVDTGGLVYSRFSLATDVVDSATQWAVHYTSLNKPTAADLSVVPDTRTVNGKRLNTDIQLVPQDLGTLTSTEIEALGRKSITISQPAGLVQGKYYPIVISNYYNDQALYVSTSSSGGADPMNNCSFDGIVRQAGWSDKSSIVDGVFTAYSSSERAIHSIIAPSEWWDVYAIYVEARQFPVEVRVQGSQTIQCTGANISYGTSTFVAQVDNPSTITGATNKLLMLADFGKGSGRYRGSSLYYHEQNKPTASDVGAVPQARTINTKPLTSDVVLSAEDVGAVPQARTINTKPLTSDVVLSAADVGALPLAGGSLVGSVYIHPSAPQEAVTGLRAAPLMRPHVNVGVVSSFIPFGHMTAQSSAGYITHLNFGLYKRGVGTWDGSGMYMATGGSDGSPTEFFLLKYGGDISHSKGHTFYHTGFKPTAQDVGALQAGDTAVAATKLATARTINGTNFDGTANITTANWGTARTLTIGNSGKSVNGGADVSWSLAEIGAAAVVNSKIVIPVNSGALGATLKNQKEAGSETDQETWLTDKPDNVTGHKGIGIKTSTGPVYWNGTSARRIYNEDFKPTAVDVGALPSGGTAVAATKLATARTIGGVSFDGTANINLPGVNTTGNQSTTGNAATATKLATARTIAGVAFDGSANITLTAADIGALQTGETAVAATKLATASTIGGVAFDGTENINLPGVNTAGNQSTTGNAATATKLETARTIGGVAFDGTANINLPGVNTTGNQSTTGNAATATKLQTARTIALTGDVTGSVNFDGSGNVSITTTVADDSHNHTIANIVDLQNTLNGKLSTSGKAADSDKLDGLDSSQFLRSDTSNTMTGNLTVTGTAAATKHQAPTHNVGTGSTGFDIAYNSTTKSLDFNFVG